MDFEEIKKKKKGKKAKLINNGLQAELTVIIPVKKMLLSAISLFIKRF